MHSKRKADAWARAAAAVIAVVGMVLVVLPALPHLSLAEDPFTPKDVVETVTKIEPDGKKTVTQTRKPDDDALLERALAPGGLLLVRIGVVALGAFLGGAVIQRVLLGHFAFKAGSLELTDLPEATEEITARLTALVDAQKQATEAAMSRAALALLRVAAVEERIDAGQGARPASRARKR